MLSNVQEIKEFESYVFFFQAEDGIRDVAVTGVQTCALPILEEAQPDELPLRERDADVGTVRADAVGHHRRLLALDPREDGAEGEQHANGVAAHEQDRKSVV